MNLRKEKMSKMVVLVLVLGLVVVVVVKESLFFFKAESI